MNNVNCESPQACTQHPKLADAETMERCAKSIEALREQGAACNDRLAICYAFLNTGRRRLARDHEYLPHFGSEVSTVYLKRRAQELRLEAAQELAPKPPLPPGSTDAFIGEIKMLARAVEISADSVLASKDHGTRLAFMKTLFNRLQHFQKRMGGIDLRGPAA